MTKKSAFACNIVKWLTCSYGLLFVASVFLQKPIYLLYFRYFGADYHYFFDAARDLIAGRNPYLNPSYVQPPLSTFVNVPLSGFDEPTAATIFFVMNLLFVFGAIFIAQRSSDMAVTERLSIFMLPMLSAPTLMLFERGNLDGVVVILVAGTIYFLRRPLICGVLLCAGILVKVYPLIFIFSLLGQKNWRVILYCAVALGAAFFALHNLFLSFFANVAARAATAGISENLSSFTFLFALEEVFLTGNRSADILFKALYYATLGLILVFGLLRDRNLSSTNRSDLEIRALMASYLVFTINIPGLVYLYSGVMIILMLIYMLDSRLVLGKYTLATLFLGSFFVFFPGRSFDLTLGHTKYSYVFNLLPPAGSAILLCFFIALRLEAIKATTSARE